MILLSITEHLEKIPFLLWLFLPVVLFFLGGLILAWWIWYKHARRLNLALAEHDRLSAELSGVYESDYDLGTKLKGAFGKQKEHWEHELSQSHGRIANLTSDLATQSTSFSDLDQNFGSYKSKSEGELKELRDARVTLEQELQDQRATIVNLEATRDDFTAQVKTLEGSLKDGEAKISTLKATRQDQESELGKLGAECTDLRAQLGDRDSKLGSLEGNLSKKVAAFGLLQTQFDDGQGEAVKLRSQISGLESNLGGKNNELEQLRNKFAGLEKSSAEKAEEIQRLRGRIGELEESSTGLQHELDGLQGQLSERDTKLGSLEGNLSEKVAAFGLLQTQFDDGKGEAENLRHRISELEENLGGKDHELEQLRNHLGGLEKSSAEKEEEIHRLHGRIGDLEESSAGLQNELDGLHGQLSERDTKLGGLEGNLSEKVAALGLLQTQFDDGKGEAENLRNRISDLEANLGGKNEELEELRHTLSGLEQSSSAKEEELVNLRGKIGDFEKSTSDQQGEISSLKGKLNEHDSQVGGLKADLAKNVASFGLLKSQFDTGKGESAELKGEIANFKSEVSEKDQRLAALKSNFGDLEKASANKQQKIEQLEARIAELSDQDAELKDLQKTLAELEKEAADKQQKIDQLRAKIAELGDQDAKLKGLQKTLAQLEKDASDKAQKISALSLTANKLPVVERDFEDYKKNSIDPAEFARLRDELNSTNANHKGTQDKLSDAISALDAERNKEPEPVTATTFFAKTGAVQDAQLGFLFRKKPAKVDNLTEISGVGPVLQPKLNKFGIYQFKQVALWSQDNIDAFSAKLDFKGRVEREQWVNQAADLHRKNHEEHLAPIVDIYYKPKKRTVEKTASSVLEDFGSEDVKFDEKLGVLYKRKPSKIDDLKRIKGVAGVLEGKLHKFGVYRFKQVALWDKANIDEFSERLSFPDRIERDQWIAQALDFHQEEYQDRLAPRYTVFHKAPVPKPPKPPKPASPADKFKGEPIKVDPKLGVLFTKKPAEIDDLKLIKGVANVLEKRLHKFGLYRFKQIALWTDDQVAEFSDQLSFPGRIERDDWVKQATGFHAQKYGIV